MSDFPAGRAVRRGTGRGGTTGRPGGRGEVHAPAGRCSHMAGPLAEGDIDDGCVRCPWHGSVFRLSDGRNVRGPAMSPQPSSNCRAVAGHVEARLRLRPHPRP
ncbi:Rieske (2Fe-2S) protein [Streptomyces globosus]